MDKTRVTLAGIPLAGNGPITWKFVTGTQPHVSAISVHRSVWERLSDKMGQDVDLEIVDSRGTKTTVQRLTILHEIPSQSPNRNTFLLADRRWKWSYALCVRDYNVTKKSGKRNALGQNVPVEGLVTVDEYEYRRSSLTRDGYRWEARSIIATGVSAAMPAASSWLLMSFTFATPM